MFEALKSNIRPKSIIVDYERAAINAIKAELSTSNIKGSFFI